MMTPHAGMVFVQHVEKAELTLAQAKVLLALEHYRSLSEEMMCAFWEVKQPALKKVIDALEKRGLVVQTDAEHGSKWVPTGEGKKLVRIITKGR